MKKFELTIVTNTRLAIASIASFVFILGALLLSLLFEKLLWQITVPVLTLAFTMIPTIYATYCKLTVISVDNKLQFKWSKKVAFNFKPIDEIDLRDIHTLIIDLDIDVEVLSAIVTENKKIQITTPINWRKDADNFIQYLKDNTNARIVSRWDKLKKTGYTRVMYLFMTFSLIIGLGFLTWIIAVHGFEKFENISASKWLILVCSILGLIRYRKFFRIN